MPAFTVYASQNLGGAISCTTMVRGVTRETWSHNKGDKAGIRIGFWIAVCATSMNRCFGSPEIVVILVEECRDQAVIRRHVHQGQRASIFGQRMPPLLRNLLDGLIKDLSWRGRGIEERDISAILGPLCAVDASHRHHLVVGLRIFVAREQWRWLEEILPDTRDAERSYVLPLIRDSDGYSIHNWTTRCGFP